MTNKKMILTKLLPFKIAIFEPIKLPAKLKIAIGMAYLNKIFPCQPKMIIEPRLVKRFTILACADDVKKSKPKMLMNAKTKKLPVPGPKKPS